jgi:hypothetical protein
MKTLAEYLESIHGDYADAQGWPRLTPERAAESERKAHVKNAFAGCVGMGRFAAERLFSERAALLRRVKELELSRGTWMQACAESESKAQSAVDG